MQTMVTAAEPMQETKHYPVMHEEVLAMLEPSGKRVAVDCTLGLGSHASKLLEAMGPKGILIGIDKDAESLEQASENLTQYKGRFELYRSDFSSTPEVLDKLNIKEVDMILFDLGISMYQLLDADRGFSFLREGPLDMRMDRDTFVSAYDLVNNLSEKELFSIFKKFGEDRYARRIAHFIVEARTREPISTTTQLAQVVMRAVPTPARYGRIHPATRIFQALRIAVNRELEILEQSLEKALPYLVSGGRMAVISFHSLEDRIVKHTFRSWAQKGLARVLTKKPLVPTNQEREANAASRSAKLRAVERI